MAGIGVIGGGDGGWVVVILYLHLFALFFLLFLFIPL